MSLFAGIKNKIAEYAEVYLKLIKLNFKGKTAGILSYFIFVLICLFVLFGIILLVGFGLTETFCSFGLPRVAAFFITVGIYLLFLLVLLALRRNITRFFANAFIRVLTDGDDEEAKN